MEGLPKVFPSEELEAMWESRGNLVASQVRDKLKRNADCSRTHGGEEDRVKEIRIVCTEWSIPIYEIIVPSQ